MESLFGYTNFCSRAVDRRAAMCSVHTTIGEFKMKSWKSRSGSGILGTVTRLRECVSAARRALLRARCLISIQTKDVRTLRKVESFRAGGRSYWVESLFRRFAKTFDLAPPPHEAQACVFCESGRSNCSKEEKRRRRQYFKLLKKQRKKLHWVQRGAPTKLVQAQQRVTNCTEDIERLNQILLRGLENTESAYQTQRQRRAIERAFEHFETISVHGYKQNLTLNDAGSALQLALEAAEQDLAKSIEEHDFIMTRDPLVLHSFYKIANWWKHHWRVRIGRRALRYLQNQTLVCRRSEDVYLEKWRRKLASRVFQACWRGVLGRRRAALRRFEIRLAASHRIQKWYRQHLLTLRLRCYRIVAKRLKAGYFSLTRSALENAASVASMFLTLEVAINVIPKENPVHPMMQTIQ